MFSKSIWSFKIIVSEAEGREVLEWCVTYSNKRDLTFPPYVEPFDQMLGFSKPSLFAICGLPKGQWEGDTSEEHM